MSMELNFTNRETYLAWRANWRAAYKELSAEIRTGRGELANTFRENSQKAYGIQSELRSNRILANRMMERLKEAKELSAEQRLAGARQAEAA